MKIFSITCITFLLVGCTNIQPSENENVLSSQSSLSSASSSTQEYTSELTLEKWNEIYGEYLAEWNGSDGTFLQPSTTTVSFENEFIKFDVPYNPIWGWREFLMPPYWIERNRVSFGAILGMEGGVRRDCFYEVEPKRNLEDVAKDSCELIDGQCTYNDTLLELKTMGNHQVLFSSEASFGTSIAEISGKDSNHSFHCWRGSLEPIVTSVEFK